MNLSAAGSRLGVLRRAFQDLVNRGTACQFHSSTAGQAQHSTRVLLVQPRQQSQAQTEELLRLAETYAGAPCTAIKVGASRGQRRTARQFFGKGVVEQLRGQIAEAQPERLIVNVSLSGVQHRNLEQEWGVPVLDRVGLIIEIFAQRARSREARLQVELAALEYRGSRLVRSLNVATGKKQQFGEGQEVVSARERGRSGASSGGLGGGGGAGETELQLQRRRIDAQRKALRLKVAQVQRTRQTQRAARLRSGMPTVGVIGYTNAGKSSLIEALTGHDVGAEDKLFATLDTTMRSVHLPTGAGAILSDTVGFISDLPVQLLDAFKGTLEEAVHADLLLHVIDAASPHAAAQVATVYDILRQLGLTDSQIASRVIEVHNKADLLHEAAACEASPDQQAADSQGSLAEVELFDSDSQQSDSRPSSSCQTAAKQQAELARVPRVAVSAVDGTGLPDLLRAIDRKISIRTGIDQLAGNVAAAGSRMLTQNVKGPYRPSLRRQLTPPWTAVGDENSDAWQPGWRQTGSTLAGRLFGAS